MATRETEEREAIQEATPTKKGSPWKWIIAGALALLLIGGGAGAYYYFTKATAAAVAKNAPPAPPPLWPMDPFIVNVQDNQGERYLKLILQVEASDAAAVQELELLKPRIRDSMLDLLTAKTLKELMDVAGKQKLREEIVLRMNSHMSKGKVNKVLFTEFIIQ